MDQHPAYETLIAQKLEQAPLPDLADSIWAAIQLELDSPLPGEGGQDPPAQTPPGKGLPGAGGLWYVAVPVLLITTLWLTVKNKKQTPSEKQPPAIQVFSDSALADSSGNKLQRIAPPGPSAGNANIQPGSPLQQDLPAGTDSAMQPVQLPPAHDSITLPPADPAPVISDSVTKAPPGKKPRGVPGITDNEYKVKAIKKDSANKDR